MTVEITEGDIAPGKGYLRKTDDEVRKLALDIVEGRVFGTWNFSDESERNQMAPMVFMVTVFLDDVTLQQMAMDDIVHVYEYLNAAGPMGVNGYPIFYSCRMLNREDSARVNEQVKRLSEVRKRYLEGG